MKYNCWHCLYFTLLLFLWEVETKITLKSKPPIPCQNFYALLVKVVNVGKVSIEWFGLLDFSIPHTFRGRVADTEFSWKKASRHGGLLRGVLKGEKKQITRIITSESTVSWDMNTSLKRRNKAFVRGRLYKTHLQL